MIPRLEASDGVKLPQPGFFGRLLESGYGGDIELSESGKTVYSTDNSIYQVKPKGILFPKDASDLKIIATVLAEPDFAGITVAPRGGGTGTNGQSLTNGIVIDCSRHMNRILEIDPDRRIARVEAGVVKDQLNRALEPYGLFFAPELSTSNRATIGGMVSTDACGQGSCLYGKTSNHVLGIRMILMDGTDWWSRPIDDTMLENLQQRQDRVGEIYRVLDRIERDKRDRIAEVFPKLNRYMTGYDLAHLRRGDGKFDLNAVLCGSEGTLGLIAEVELNLLALPVCSALINIRYDDFNTALEDARLLVTLSVASVETVDEKVLLLAKGDIIWGNIARFFPDDAAGPANGINIAEVLAESPAELREKIALVTARLDADPCSGRKGYTIAWEKQQVETIWAMRKRAVGLLGNVEGSVRPVAFVEDTAVPPENLAAYIREFRALLDAKGLDYGMFGHVDAGVLHVRPALDLTEDRYVPLVREISDRVVALTRKYGGVLWGEHGKGVRSEYVPEFFGDLYPALQAIKRTFDPGNQLNPGKIATPSSGELLKIDAVPLRGASDRIIPRELRAAFDNAAYCNGNGACFDFDADAAMCPSYKATRDRRFSPKGRASLIREWLRLLSEKAIDPRAEAERLRSRSPFLNLPLRAWNSLNPANRDDFSHEVRETMDTCLACKACAGQCPVKVNVPAFRAKFLELYYGRYLRPMKDPVVAIIEWTLPLAAKLKPLYNAFVGSVVGRALLRFAGLTALPKFPGVSLARERHRLGIGIADPGKIASLPAEERKRIVVFIQDAFTSHFDPHVILDAMALTKKMGMTPLLSQSSSNGKALHVHGYLGAFAKTAARNARYLDALAETGATLVGLDPSMTLTYRSEYKDEPAAKPKAKVLLPQEWLVLNLARLAPKAETAHGKRYRLMGHCTEKTNAPVAHKTWSDVFDKIGVRLEFVETGCCGMAGTFGHEVANRQTSETLYAMSWQAKIAASGNGEVLMATGYSCRSQVKQIDARVIPHPIQVINGLVGDFGGRV